MIVAILGGTGNLGKGLAVRFSLAGFDVIVGSRDVRKAEKKAEEYSDISGCSIRGMDNRDALKACDVAILTIPWDRVFEFVSNFRDLFRDKIVVSPVVPMKKVNGLFVYVQLPEGSAAEKIASILRESRVVSAYHNIPARRFADLNEKFEFDVAVCGDDEEAKRVVIEMTNRVDCLRALDAGPLRNSRIIESLTPLLINISLRNRLGELGIRFV